MTKQTHILFALALIFSIPVAAVDPHVVSGFYIEWPSHKGLPTMVEVSKQTEDVRSPYQHIEMFETATFGNMMLIDDVIMLTQRDNAGYHEMIAQVPLNAHPNPQKVLVVGGGDGGSITQVLKHDTVKEIVICEIDAKVIELSKQYFPEFAASFDNERVTVVSEDASQFIKTQHGQFDVIIVDSTDPFGPGEALFTQEFYKDLHAALSDEGIAVTQSESLFLYTDLVEKLYKQNKEIFAYASYYYTLVPTYPSGTIGFSFCSKKHDPFTNLDADRIAKLDGLEYYNEGLHRASFQLPQFMVDRLEGKTAQ